MTHSTKTRWYLIAGAGLTAYAGLATAVRDHVRIQALGTDSTTIWRASDVRVPRRQFAVTAWDTVWQIPSGADTAGFTPRFLAADADRVYVFDQRFHTVAAFDAAGHRIWDLQQTNPGVRLGAGVDIKVAPNHELFILDPTAHRILRVDRNGRHMGDVPLPDKPRIAQIAPLANGQVVLAPLLGAEFALITVDGQRLRWLKPPWDGMQRLSPLARQGLLASNHRGDWTFGFSYGDGWFAYTDSLGAPFIGQYVDFHAFPQPRVAKDFKNRTETSIDGAPCTACAVAMSDTALFVVAGGSHEAHGNVVDEFAIASGRYLRSYRLPENVISFASQEGLYYGIVTHGESRLVMALRPRRN
jgi:hypothetical protein